MPSLDEQLRVVIDHGLEPVTAHEAQQRASRGPVRRPRRQAALALAMVGVAVTVVVTLLLSGGSAHRVEVPPADDGATFTTDELKAILMPVSYADLLKSAELDSFSAAVWNTQISNCLVDHGFEPLPYTGGGPPLPPGRVHLFEDPEYMRQNGLLGPMAVVEGDASQPTPEVPSDVRDSCSQRSVDATAPLTALLEPFRGGWFQELERVEMSDAVQATWVAWAACMRGAGYQVASEAEFNAYVDRTNQTLASIEEFRANDRKLGRDFASCLDQAGVIDARIAGRVPAREVFLRSHEDAFRSAQKQLPGVIASLSEKYGVVYGDTSPTTTTTSRPEEQSEVFVSTQPPWYDLEATLEWCDNAPLDELAMAGVPGEGESTFTAWDGATQKTIQVDTRQYCKETAVLAPDPAGGIVASFGFFDGHVRAIYHEAVRRVSGGAEVVTEGALIPEDEARVRIAAQREQRRRECEDDPRGPFCR